MANAFTDVFRMSTSKLCLVTALRLKRRNSPVVVVLAAVASCVVISTSGFVRYVYIPHAPPPIDVNGPAPTTSTR